MSKSISVYYCDPLCYRVDLDPERWESSQRLITDEEHAYLVHMGQQYAEWQAKLKEISTRPEWDAINNKFEED